MIEHFKKEQSQSVFKSPERNRGTASYPGKSPGTMTLTQFQFPACSITTYTLRMYFSLSLSTWISSPASIIENGK